MGVDGLCARAGIKNNRAPAGRRACAAHAPVLSPACAAELLSGLRSIEWDLQDLEERGLLDETLVIWGGEFGRLPVAQKSQKPGRDHNPHAGCYWFAGGGVKSGTSYGETDEIGHQAVVDKVEIHDLHATILHLLGLDHKKLTFKHNGRRFRLTDVAGRVIKQIVA